MSPETDIRFHNVIASEAMIERAAQSEDKNPLQIEMAKAVLEFVSTDSGRAQFGHPETGSTLEQTWRLRLSSSGLRLVCLVAANRVGLVTTSIPTVERLPPEELGDVISRLLTENPNTSLHPFVYDGARGYAISLTSYDATSRNFAIIEPNPAESKLGTKRAGDGSWVLHADDLSRVICGLFLPPPIWADLTGLNYTINYASLKDTELWSFFGLRETKRQDIANDQSIVFLEPGGFKKENRIQIRLDHNDRIRGAVLLQARPWMISDDNVNPFALDLAKGFINALTPQPDDTKDLVAGIWALKSLEEMKATNITPSSEIGHFLQVYVGAKQEAWVLQDFVRIQAKTIKLDNIDYLQIQMDHW